MEKIQEFLDTIFRDGKTEEECSLETEDMDPEELEEFNNASTDSRRVCRPTSW